MKKFLHLFSAKPIGLLTGFVFLLAFANAQVINTTHPLNSPYATIQAAINDAITVNDDVIVVAGGIYNESINITKSINLRGAQADNCANTREGAESIINCVDGIGINASNVTINGFTVQNQTSQNAPGIDGFTKAAVPVAPANAAMVAQQLLQKGTVTFVAI